MASWPVPMLDGVDVERLWHESRARQAPIGGKAATLQEVPASRNGEAARAGSRSSADPIRTWAGCALPHSRPPLRKRRRSFLASLDGILRRIGCLNRRDIAKGVDDIIISSLASEREAFLAKLTGLVSLDSDQPTQKYEHLCARLLGIAERQ